MLREEIIMCNSHGLGEASCSTAEESCRCDCLDRLQVIKSYPILFAEVHQLSPRSHAIRYRLAHIVEDPDILRWNARLLSSAEK